MGTAAGCMKSPSVSFYETLSRTNSAIVRMRDPQALFNEVCAICVDHGVAKMAYIVMDDEAGYARPVAWAGPAESFLADIEIPLNPTRGAGPGPIAIAIQHGEPYVANDLHADPATPPWRRRAIDLGSNATAAFPFRKGARVTGALSLHSGRKDYFDSEIVQLLQSMVGDLSYALDNIDRERHLAEAVRESNAGRHRFQKIFDTSPVATAIWRARDARLLEANDAFCTLLGFSRDDRASEAFQAEAERFHAETGLAAHATQPGGADTRLAHETHFRSRSGHLRDLTLSFEAIDFAGEACALTVISDVTERRAYESCLEHCATHDGLTRLPNRDLFYDQAPQALNQARRANRMAAVIVVGLNRMRVVNDELGHRVGDGAIQLVGERLSALIADGELLARLSGDEFVMLLADLHVPPDAGARIGGILDSLAKPFRVLDNELSLTASAGVAFFPRDGTDIDALIRKADSAMYRAKEVGSGTFQLYEARMAVASRQTKGLHTELRYALEREQLYVEYQPKVRLSDGRISGVEALLRWRHPTLGEISPATFVPVAEESGLIVPIGEWALREACAQAVAWQKDGLPPLPVAVNVSARQLLTANFEARIIDALQLTGLSPEWLELEITESVIAKDVEQASATICDLRRIGVRFALDDFGTGYSSLGYLKRFQVDRVKIDQSFIRTIPTDAGDTAIVRAIVNLAKSAGFETTAEGVEKAEQCRFLAEVGCDEIQGFLFSRPLSAIAVSRKLRGREALDPVTYRSGEQVPAPVSKHG